MKRTFTSFQQLLFIGSLFFNTVLHGQDLPHMLHLSDDGRRLIAGGVESAGFYDERNIPTIELWFSQDNWWQLLTANYEDGIDIPALMITDGDTLQSPVGVRFKGSTSYFQNNTQKKSFNITIDHDGADQDVKGYETLNLNCGFLDHSSIREVLYLNLIRHFVPAAQGNYARLYLNGTYWGPYFNIQQLNGDFVKEWYPSSDGTRWRAVKPDAFTGGPGGPGGGTGGAFGTGYSSLNYLGADTTTYKSYYTLKKAHKQNPWDDLVHVTDILNNTPLNQLEAALREVMDVDRALWLLAVEILFSDDDSYVFKGGMDYYLYWDPETGRMTPIEYDGNTVMELSNANWAVFYKQNDTRYPLMNRLFAVPSLRQRYLAHVRTLLAESLVQDSVDAKIDAYAALINDLVQNDPKAIYTYNQFLSGQEDLKDFVQVRRDFYLNNAEVNRADPEFAAVSWSVDGVEWAQPGEDQAVSVTATVATGAGISAVNLYYGTGIIGHFTTAQMYDDGLHQDGTAGDGVYGASIPAFEKGTYVRFYFEAVSGDAFGTRRYEPRGAEHDVYFYQVEIGTGNTDVVVNEFAADNATIVADQAGEYEDWIELYNNSADPVDMSGWYLSDDEENLTKWTFPEGTVIQGNGYLIVWADEDGSQEGLHANFKLSKSGEVILLLDPDQNILQHIVFGEQQEDLASARVPNGTGDFVIQAPTFNANNDLVSGIAEPAAAGFRVFPNPASGMVAIRSAVGNKQRVQVLNAIGQPVFQGLMDGETMTVNTGTWPAGMYVVKVEDAAVRLVVSR
ncbi:MAG: CotH kinase family protein [Lewinellaceae bacterium]|nr:CotH kinase family protein [Lewinellaceae bacterium]